MDWDGPPANRPMDRGVPSSKEIDDRNGVKEMQKKLEVEPPANITPVLPPNLGKALLEPLNHAIAAGEREALKIGVPSTDVIEMLLNHLASVVAMIEPVGARAATIEGLVAGFAPMVQKHVQARYMTPGGILTPRPVEELQHG